MSLQQLHNMNGTPCPCGKAHSFSAQIVSGSGAVEKLPGLVRSYAAAKPYIVSDQNTHAAAGGRVCALLTAHGIGFHAYTFPRKAPEPDEGSVGAAVMHMEPGCDLIIGVGSGVINDICKILSALSGKPYIIVATAPSMDGYASATSSMTRDGLKISLPSRGADVIVGDTDILCQAPAKLLRSGLGDMIAKYVSICEWRIAHLVIGEYYCEEIAALIRSALKQCTDQAAALLRREPAAVEAVFNGLVIAGVAMNYAGLSRPASGVEHYISHVLDMRGAEFGTSVELHGIQCAIGTLIAVKLYEKLKAITPDRDKALAYAEGFDYPAWAGTLRSLLGTAAESMIALEEKEHKYDPALHKARLEVLLQNWDAILRIIEEELPSSDTLEALLATIGAPKSLEEIGIDEALLPTMFQATKDIRNKYVLSRLAWDLGILEELI